MAGTNDIRNNGCYQERYCYRKYMRQSYSSINAWDDCYIRSAAKLVGKTEAMILGLTLSEGRWPRHFLNWAGGPHLSPPQITVLPGQTQVTQARQATARRPT